jgi:hypothetical protein
MSGSKKVYEIAAVCHEANRAYCESIGDLSQKPWCDADQWQRESAVKGVRFIIDNPGASPSATHESWLEEKRRDGWVYGPVKDVALKVHPCCVPYESLPVEQRAKDYIFSAIVNIMWRQCVNGLLVSKPMEIG